MNDFDEKVYEMIEDITGAMLTPGKPEQCQGNGTHKDFECCCDECEWLDICFSEIEKDIYFE